MAQTARGKRYSGFIERLKITRRRRAEEEKEGYSPKRIHVEEDERDQHNQREDEILRGKSFPLLSLRRADVGYADISHRFFRVCRKIISHGENETIPS